jgi:2-oxoglutarate ferredoxin oxidoreductase subunit alpha
MKPIEAVNDFVIKFANVNGSGSASANELFAKSILRMGVPVSPRNIFPSNIQGLPTWYEVRVCERGWLGRRGGIDMMVAMNPQTWAQDVAEIEPGGYLFYDSTRPLPASAFRQDIHVIGMPVTEICNAAYEDPRQRTLFKNIMVLGALSVLLEVDPAVIEKLFSEQYKGKERLLESNVRALHAGRSFVSEHLDAPIGLRVRRADAVGDRIFMEGNAAAALGWRARLWPAPARMWWRDRPASVIASYPMPARMRAVSSEAVSPIDMPPAAVIAQLCSEVPRPAVGQPKTPRGVTLETSPRSDEPPTLVGGIGCRTAVTRPASGRPMAF